MEPATIRSGKARKTGQRTDLQVVMVKCYWRGHQFIVDYHTARDEDPDELIIQMNIMLRKYPILRCGVEGVAYQRTLKWFIERQIKKGMLKSVYILELPAIGNKYTRIIQAHAGPASNGQLHVHRTHTEFIDQFIRYPDTKFKDLLDVSAMCGATISPAQAGMVPPDILADVDESEIPALEWDRSCP